MHVANLIVMNPGDTVAVATRDLKKGEAAHTGDIGLTLTDEIPMGHKVALVDMAAGTDVIRYGDPIGHATRPIGKGGWVHVHNLFTNLEKEVAYTYSPVTMPAGGPPGDPPTFQGYRRRDGRVGIRNELWIIPTVFCVNGPAQQLADRINARYPAGPGFDGAFALTHANGCSQVGQDLLYTQNALAGLVHHPNAGGVLILGLGCESNCLDCFLPLVGDLDPQRVKVLNCQDVEDELADGMALLETLYAALSADRRSPCKAGELAIAVNCGGSDAFSGITANPLVGKITDRLTGFGGTVVMTEVPEMFGAEHLLMRRAENRMVFDAIVGMMNDYKAYFRRYGEEIYKSPVPGNIAGGISTLEEKSLGCTEKGGQAVVRDVIPYGGRLRKKGFNLLSGPGNDLAGITAQEAAGCVMTIFTTGCGTPAGFATPLLRLSSNSRVGRHKARWIDYDAGALMAGKTMNDAAGELFDLILRVAGGEMKTRSEACGYRQIGFLRDGVTD
ncbi:altronate hydrolase [Desulfosarcina alkanivorans]|uniref:Altronate hydrolase n=1 Tax=Desulfosarcina alkanivorans TaxID=571177 RepID=A0A5K7YQ26_9BACT|nr:altronate hydrolase [Desulfosarcina alkanivorans]